MVKYFPINTKAHAAAKISYERDLETMTSRGLIKEFISFLDYKEESDSGREFHPIEIISCRAMMSEPLNMLLTEMRKRVGD